MSRSSSLLAAALLIGAAARAQTPVTPPTDTRPAADAPAATAPSGAQPAAAPADPSAAAPAAPSAAPAAAAKDAPAAAEMPADATPCSTEEIDKHIDAALAAIAASPSYTHAGGNFKKAELQLRSAKKSAAAACKVANKPKKKSVKM